MQTRRYGTITLHDQLLFRCSACRDVYNRLYIMQRIFATFPNITYKKVLLNVLEPFVQAFMQYVRTTVLRWWRCVCAWMIQRAMLSGAILPPVRFPVADSSSVIGQTTGDSEALSEKRNHIKDDYVTQSGVTEAPPWPGMWPCRYSQGLEAVDGWESGFHDDAVMLAPS